MPVSLENIRAELLPGLQSIVMSDNAIARAWAMDREIMAANVLNVGAGYIDALPAISPQAIVAMGAAAVIVRNPLVTKRNLFGLK